MVADEMESPRFGPIGREVIVDGVLVEEENADMTRRRRDSTTEESGCYTVGRMLNGDDSSTHVLCTHPAMMTTLARPSDA